MRKFDKDVIYICDPTRGFVFRNVVFDLKFSIKMLTSAGEKFGVMDILIFIRIPTRVTN